MSSTPTPSPGPIPCFCPGSCSTGSMIPPKRRRNCPGPEGITVAELYVEHYGDRLNRLERTLLAHINREPYSFWEVLKVDRGKRMWLKDVVEGSSIEVQERLGSEHVEQGDLLFGRAVTVDGVGMLVGLAPIVIPPRSKPHIIRLRNHLGGDDRPITRDTLGMWDIEIRDLYFQIDRSLFSPPRVTNTDGDPIEFHRLIYDVPPLEETFEKLCDLCATREPRELRRDALLDKEGKIIRIEIPWSRRGHTLSPEMDDTIVGRIVLNGPRLMAEVNSARRAETLRGAIDARLGDGARFRLDEIQDAASLIDDRWAGSIKVETPTEENEFMEDPAIQERLSEMVSGHWERWVDEKIPALGGKTPRQAVQSPDGREAVEALLLDIDRNPGQDRSIAEANRTGTRRVRELLGLLDD